MPKKDKIPLVILPTPVEKSLTSVVKSVRVYIDKLGNELPWVCDQNPRMWLGWEDDAEEES